MSQTAQALASARRARECADSSGHLRTKTGAIANLAFLKMLEGELGEADAVCREGLSLSQPTADVRLALLETRAQIMLARGDSDECRRVLDEMAFAPTGTQWLSALVVCPVRLYDARET